MRKLPFIQELYRDAVTLSPDDWMKKYHVHEGYSAALKPLDLNRDPRMQYKLFVGWVRLFHLATQLVSEEKGHGGRPPADKMFVGARAAFNPDTGKMVDDMCAIAPHEDGIQAIVTQNFILSSFGPAEHNFAYENYNVGHMPGVKLDPFQSALVCGLEEGLHAEDLRKSGRSLSPGIVKNPGPEKARALYENDAAEKAIHSDLVALWSEMDRTYDLKAWENFMQTYQAAARQSSPPARPQR